MNPRRLAMALSVGLGAVAVPILLWILGNSGTTAIAAPFLSAPSAPKENVTEAVLESRLYDAAPVHYVAVTGTDIGDCNTPASACRTIQYAVDQAVDGDEIRVAAGVYTGINAYGGLAQVVYISKNVTMKGGYTTTNWITAHPVIQPTTLDAQAQGRVLYITGNISPTIEGLRIVNGNATGLGGDPTGQDAGGGVYVITATAALSNNQVYSNTGYRGGGLYLRSSGANFAGNSVSANTARNGGGLMLVSSDATLIGNDVFSNRALQGGGLTLYWSAASLYGNIVATNVVTENGGGLIVGESPALLIGNRIISNTAGRDGGGLYLGTSSATLTGNSVAGNTAGDDGGGLGLRDSPATLKGNTITANTSGNNGAGLHLDFSDATLTGNIVTDNTSRYRSGGGVSLGYSDATLINNIFTDNVVAIRGGGVYILSCSPRLLHNTVAHNEGGDGSGIFVGNLQDVFSTLTMTNTILVNQSVGIYVESNNTAVLESTLFSDNGTNWDNHGTISLNNTHFGDPAFVDPDVRDYHIGPSSAAIDAGVDAAVDNDLDGEARPLDGDLDGVSEFDIGADEYAQQYSYLHLPVVLRNH